MNLEGQSDATNEDSPSRAIEAIYAIGHALLEQQRALEAVSVFRVMLRLVPTDERAWLGLASCHEEMDDLTIAAELYGAGYAAAQPPSTSCLSALARLMRVVGDAAMASECEAELLTVGDETTNTIGGAR